MKRSRVRLPPVFRRVCRDVAVVMLASVPGFAAHFAVERFTTETRFHTAALIGLMLYVFVLIALLMRRRDLRAWWRVKKRINAGAALVPCPNCTYDLFEPADPDAVHTCPECGHTVRAGEAVASWSAAPGVKAPEAWGKGMGTEGT